MVYLANGRNDRIISLESKTGKVAPCDQPEMLGPLHDVTYCEGNETLIVRHSNDHDDIITCYNVPIMTSGQNSLAVAQIPPSAAGNEPFVKYDYDEDQYMANEQKSHTWPVPFRNRGE